jgi:hypothetical protein
LTESKLRRFPLFMGILLSASTLYGQIAINPSSAVIATLFTPPCQGSCPGQDFRIIGISPGTPFTPSLAYPPGKASGWASISQITGSTITVALTGPFPETQDPAENNTLNNQGKYEVYLRVAVGVVTYTASLLAYLFPTDNQFIFTDSKGNDISNDPQDYPNGGITLTTAAPNAQLSLQWASNNFDPLQKEPFQISSAYPWLTVSPASGTTPMKGVLISANSNGLQPSPTPYIGSIQVTDVGNLNQNSILPVSFYVQGVPQLPTDGTTLDFSYGSAGLYNGSSGYVIQVPSANAQWTVSAGATQPIRIYARYGSDVTPAGYDAVSSQSINPSLTLGPGTSPPLQAGTWYIAIEASSTGLTTGHISASKMDVSAPCTYSLPSPSASLSAAAGSGSFTLTTQSGCGWSASSDSAWLRIIGPTSGTATATTVTIVYSYDANTGPARTGDISVGGQTFTVTEASGQIAAPQIQSFTATPSNIPYGASSTLSWSVAGATTVSIDQGIGSVPASASKVLTPGRTRTYTLVAQNSR